MHFGYKIEYRNKFYYESEHWDVRPDKEENCIQECEAMKALFDQLFKKYKQLEQVTTFHKGIEFFFYAKKIGVNFLNARTLKHYFMKEKAERIKAGRQEYVVKTRAELILENFDHFEKIVNSYIQQGMSQSRAIECMPEHIKKKLRIQIPLSTFTQVYIKERKRREAFRVPSATDKSNSAMISSDCSQSNQAEQAKTDANMSHQEIEDLAFTVAEMVYGLHFDNIKDMTNANTESVMNHVYDMVFSGQKNNYLAHIGNNILKCCPSIKAQFDKYAPAHAADRIAFSIISACTHSPISNKVNTDLTFNILENIESISTIVLNWANRNNIQLLKMIDEDISALHIVNNPDWHAICLEELNSGKINRHIHDFITRQG